MRRRSRLHPQIPRRAGSKGAARLRSVIVASLAMGSWGCSAPLVLMSPPSQYDPARTQPHAASEARPAPFIHSAHAGRPIDRHGHGGVLVVFSSAIDAASLEPEAFALATEGGRRLFPTRATLAPAAELDEHRSVMLQGIPEVESDTVKTVVVVGNLYDVHGIPLRGANAAVAGADVKVRPVTSEIVAPSEARCAQQAQVVRVYWSLPIYAVEGRDLVGVVVELTDGSKVTPVRFEDAEEGPHGDNVLDLCLRTTTSIAAVEFRAGLFEDAAGRPNHAARIERFDDAREREDRLTDGSIRLESVVMLANL